MMLFIGSFTILLAFSGCEKDPGEGGLAVITGKIQTREFSNAGNLLGEYYAADQRIFIIYGDGSAPDNDVRSGLEGTFRFEYLHKGSYTVYAISECDTCISNQRLVSHPVTISERKQVVEIPDLVVDKY